MGPKICYAYDGTKEQDSNCYRFITGNVSSSLSSTLKHILTCRRGKAIALRLAQDGYDVCINDIPANKSGAEEVVSEIKNMGRNAFPFMADVSNMKEVENMVEASANELGPLNTMVANAGIAQVKALIDLTEQDLKRMFEVNGNESVLI